MPKLTEEELQHAKFVSLYNNFAIRYSNMCGCYNCLEKFKGTLVTEFDEVDETGVCPKCGVTAIIPDTTHDITKEILREVNKRFVKSA